MSDAKLAEVQQPQNQDTEIKDIPNTPSDDSWEQSGANPRNWPGKKKWRPIAIVSFQAFLSPLASSLMAPSLPDIAKHYHISSPTITALTLTIYLLAWALGPLFLAPFSEIWGRRWIINGSAIVFLTFNIGCIFAPTTGSFIAFRFLAGIGASSPISIAGAVIADLFVPAERAPATGIYGMGLLLGPPIGPLIGGYIGLRVGFKYGFVLVSTLAGVALALSVWGLPETYHPVIQSQVNRHVGAKQGLPRKRLHRLLLDAGSRPVILLSTNPICFLLGLYSALVYGYLNMFFTTFPTIFGEHYGFDVGSVGLTYLAGGLGELSATAVGSIMGNQIYHKVRKTTLGGPITR